MAPRDPARWLPATLLLLWVPGCLALSGPRRVTGIVGGSLSVRCRYEKSYTENTKYWCRNPCSLLNPNKIVETTKSQREVRKDRVSIRDDPANRTFTVTLERLREEDGDTYWCGIHETLVADLTFKVVVTVIPATSPSPTTSTQGRTSAITTGISTVSAAQTTRKEEQSPRSKDDPPEDHRLPVLVSLLLLLLLLLVGASLLAWRMVRRRIRADEKPELPLNPSEAAQQSELCTEPCYANLELQTWPLVEQPRQPCQVEVEYSTVQAPRQDFHYSTLVFNSQDSKDNTTPAQRPPEQETEYSVIRKTKA